MGKTIAILGVDGTGKSSVIQEIQKRLGKKCCVKYMGYRSFDDPRIEKINNSAHGFVSGIKLKYLIYKEYLRRYKGAKEENKLVIFDRYVHEIYINSNGIGGIINKVLYKYLYPKPDLIVYLHCPAEVSLSRKDDIPNEQVFRAMKSRFDATFMNNKHCLCLSSEDYTSPQLADKIIEYINKNII